MFPVSEKYVGSPCEVKSMENEPILLGYIKGIDDNGFTICSKSSSNLPIIHCNTTVKVDIFNSVLGFKVMVGIVFVSSKELLKITDLQNAADFEKREFFRVRVDIDTEACKLSNETAQKSREQCFRIKIHDLSLNGMSFTTDSNIKLHISDRLCVNLLLYNKEIMLLAKIIRKINKGGSEKYNDSFGCEFLDNTGMQFDVLSRYLLDCQRQQIQSLKLKRF